MIDKKAMEILTIIQAQVRLPNVEIARRVGLAPSAVLERIRKMESQGLIEGYEVRLNPKMLARGLVAFIFIRTNSWNQGVKVGKALTEIPEVLEVHHIAGEDCLLAKVRTSDTEDLGRLLRDQIGMIKSVQATRTTIVLMTEKETMHFPLPDTRNNNELG